MKEFFEKYLIKTNIWVALCFAGMLAFFQLVLYELNLYVLGIVFFGTIAVYNFTRVKNLKEFVLFKSENKLQIFLTYLGLVCTLICVILRGFEFKTFLYLGVLGFVSFCYNLPFSNLGLRAIPFLKLFLIAFVWAGSSIGLLLVVHHSVIQYQFLFLAVFFFVIGITIPFDIRDQITDEPDLKTIPQTIGLKAAKSLAVISLILSGILFYSEFGEMNVPVISWLFTLAVSMLLALNSSDKRSELFYSFWIESCSLLPLLIYLALNLF